MSLSDRDIWVVILVLGAGTYLMRFSFLGLLGARPYPEWALRLLRYAPHAVLPGMLVPMLLPQDGGGFDPIRMAAVALTLAVGVVTRSTTMALGAGAAVYFGLRWLT